VTDLGVSIGVALGYFALCRFGLSFDVGAGVSSFWPASGLLTGLLLVAPRTHWAAIATGACIGGGAAHVATGLTAMVGVGYALIGVGESVTARLLVRRLSPDAVRMRQPGDVIALSGFSIIAASAGATLAAALAASAAHADFWTAFRTWMGAHVTGMVTLGPAMLVVARDGHRVARWSIRGSAEAALMLTLLAAASWRVFFAPHTVDQTGLRSPFRFCRSHSGRRHVSVYLAPSRYCSSSTASVSGERVWGWGRTPRRT